MMEKRALKERMFEGEDVPDNILPEPKGWRILVGMLKIEEKTSGGIILTDEYVEGQGYLRNKAKVLKIGHLCYMGDKFTGGVSIDNRQPIPWCKVGDIVEIGQYDGQSTYVEYNGESHSLKYVNDDCILGTE